MNVESPAPSAEAELERAIDWFLQPADERGLDPTWEKAQREVRELSLRPAKRVRPKLLMLGYQLATHGAAPPNALVQFAAGLELLHSFLLIHDDVADRAELRRGGPTLHRSLAMHGRGEDLAVVAGDHLFARAMELMLTTPWPSAAKATAHVLAVCRHTAVGQYLDLSLSQRPMPEVTVFEALRVARLKTANYSFGAPLQCGAMLAGAAPPLIDALGRIGCAAGMAFQLQDDLLGLYGQDVVAGKSGSADLVEGKRTVPLLVAHQRATPQERALLENVATSPTPDLIEEARRIIVEREGVALTRRLIDRYASNADRAVATLPASSAVLELRRLLARLSSRNA